MNAGYSRRYDYCQTKGHSKVTCRGDQNWNSMEKDSSKFMRILDWLQWVSTWTFFEDVENWETISQDQVKWEIRCLLLLLFECCYYWPRILLHTLQSSILYSPWIQIMKKQKKKKAISFLLFTYILLLFFRKLGWFTHCGKRLTFVQNILILV